MDEGSWQEKGSLVCRCVCQSVAFVVQQRWQSLKAAGLEIEPTDGWQVVSNWLVQYSMIVVYL